MTHIPVLLEESVNLLVSNPHGIYIDGTFGRGGHTKKILSKLSSKGSLIAFDKDIDAVEFAKSTITDKRFSIIHGTLTTQSLPHLTQKVDGILFDFGLCSTQLDQADRGFSFNKPGPLDMRMNQTVGISASEWLSEATEKDITEVLSKYGEEKHARSIAKLILNAQQKQPITSTLQLSHLIESRFPRVAKKHPATKSFQAIRIHINNEVEDLKLNLKAADDLLIPEGIIVTIAFHSLEDREIKEFFKPSKTEVHRDIPLNSIINKRYNNIARKIKPSLREVALNQRSRSAVMRAYQKK
ncbi:MAG: 16S rRNA (cytosine(1402)-N(4))-methyltransferase RsmH [Gammaproteobacteria bacterium]